MSPIARILIILNLVLAAAFVGWAANALSANADFKSKYDTEVKAHTTAKTTLDAELSKVRSELRVAQESSNTFMQARDAAVADKDRTKADLDQEISRNAKFEADLNKIAATLSEIEASKAKLQADKDRAVESRTEAEKAAATAGAAQRTAEEKLGEVESQLAAASNQVADLEMAKTSLEKEKASVETQLASLIDLTGVKVGDIAAMPKIDARVLDVNTSIKPGLVSINVGEAAGVKRGYTFEIFDGKAYKGQVRIEFVHPNLSSGVIVRQVKDQAIRQGDGASTRL
jgi:myosin heavy subunit